MNLLYFLLCWHGASWILISQSVARSMGHQQRPRPYRVVGRPMVCFLVVLIVYWSSAKFLTFLEKSEKIWNYGDKYNIWWPLRLHFHVRIDGLKRKEPNKQTKWRIAKSGWHSQTVFLVVPITNSACFVFFTLAIHEKSDQYEERSSVDALFWTHF